MSTKTGKLQYDAVVIGSGPNGLACAITLARAGRSVVVFEAGSDPGGGMRSRALTRPGFVHDVCSAVHPLGVVSPFFAELPLGEFGLEWIYPEASVVHALSPERPVVLYPSLERTVAELGSDGAAYQRLVAPFVESFQALLRGALGPFNPFPKNPLLMARFGWRGMKGATQLARRWFKGVEAPALFAGLAAHSILPLEQRLTAAVGMLFAVMGHTVSWPIASGGSGQIALAMTRYLESHGGKVVVNTRVLDMRELPAARAYFFDTIPRDMARICGDRLNAGFRQKLEKFRHGPGVFKVDWALDGPVPWKQPGFRAAATVHIGGTIEEVAAAERACWDNEIAEEPFILFAQQSLFDASRAPEGKHTGWGYCHVPAGSTVDMTERIERRIETFAPGFRDLILERHVMPPAAMAAYNANYVGGDISGGVMDLWQTFRRPASVFSPYATSARDIFICSSSTPPGAGVHGMCGYFAAKAALCTVLRE